MNVTFYRYMKRENSTRRPSSGGTSYDCILKEPSSVIDPVISLQWTGSGSPVQFNYAYIATFSRYYWVRNWTYQDRQWRAELQVDVLASWKTNIGSANKYVLRAASKFSVDVLDNKYAAKDGILSSTQSVQVFGNTYDSGCYVVGIISSSGSGTLGGVNYYAMSLSQVATLVQTLYANALALWNLQGQTVEDVLKEAGQVLLKTLLKPFDYIQSVKWFPFTPGGSAVDFVMAGYIPVGVSAIAISAASAKIVNTYTLSYASDPVTEMRWKTVAPFRWYTVNFPPFGDFTLDAARVQAPGGVLSATVYSDAISGQGRLHIYKASAGNMAAFTDTLVDSTTQIGMPISIANNSIDYLGALRGTLGAASSVVDIARGGFQGVGSLAANLASAADSLFPAPTSKGSSAGTIMGDGKLHFNQHDLTPVDEDIAEFGRPLCEVTMLSTLSGYILCEDGDISAPATIQELQAISAFLTGGFFYE